LGTTTSVGTRARVSKTAEAVTVATQVSEDTIRDLSEVFKMLADRSRLTILLALAHQGPMNVTALRDLLAQSQPAVSHHLALMRTAHLVRCDRQGKHCYYRIDSDRVRGLLDDLFLQMGNGTKQIHLDDIALSLKRR
jgi:DNA-binding transcriptional ArsR family regulator